MLSLKMCYSVELIQKMREGREGSFVEKTCHDIEYPWDIQEHTWQ